MIFLRTGVFALLCCLAHGSLIAAEGEAEATKRRMLQVAFDQLLISDFSNHAQAPSSVAFISRMASRQADPKPSLAVAEKYWQHLTTGPRYDAKHGGFYTFDATTQMPNSNKGLLGQAIIAQALLEAVQMTGKGEYREAALKTLNYVLRDLSLDDGGFAAANNMVPADNGEGALVRVRIGTYHPSWNGFMISALARGYIVLGQQTFYDAATKAATLLLDRCTTAEDCLGAINGALALYQVAGEARWLAAAITLQDRLDREFWDEGTKQYSMSASDSTPPYVAIMNVLQLIIITDDDHFRERANILITSALSKVGTDLTNHPGLLCAIDQQLGPAPHLVIVGDPAAAETRALFAIAHRSYQPRLVLVTHAGDPIQAELRKRFPAMVPVPKVKGKSTAYLCIGMLCNRPVNDPAELDKQLSEVSYRW